MAYNHWYWSEMMRGQAGQMQGQEQMQYNPVNVGNEQMYHDQGMGMGMGQNQYGGSIPPGYSGQMSPGYNAPMQMPPGYNNGPLPPLPNGPGAYNGLLHTTMSPMDHYAPGQGYGPHMIQVPPNMNMMGYQGR
jgi:hypothetical protein